MLELGGVPTEERFKNLTEAQWSLLIYKHAQMKMEKYDNDLSVAEYIAQMTSPAPKAVAQIAEARRKKMRKIRLEESGEEDKNIVAEDSEKVVRKYSIDGEIVNTSFADAIKDAIGDSEQTEATLKAIMGDEYSGKATVYTVDKQNLDSLKNHKDLEAKMEQIIQQSQVQPPAQPEPLSAEEIAALNQVGFDTIEF